MPDTDGKPANASEAYVKPSTLDGKTVDEALGLKAVSICKQA